MKKALKILLIFVGIIVILFLAAAGVIFGILTSDTWSEKKVTTKYGDEFVITHEEFLDYHAETRDMLERLFKGEYDGLKKYGLTAEVIADEDRLREIISAAYRCS